MHDERKTQAKASTEDAGAMVRRTRAAERNSFAMHLLFSAMSELATLIEAQSKE